MTRKLVQSNNDVPIVITPEEKDKIVEALIQVRKNNFTFGYNDVPNISLEKYQFEEVIEEMSQMGLISYTGYLDGGKKHKTAKLDEFYRFGGFKAKDKLLFDKLKRIELELELLKKQSTPQTIEKLNSISGIVASITQILQSTLCAL